MTATRLLEEQGVDIKTHDIVTTSSGDQLANHAVVTVQSAYQTTINIDGTAVPFWTVATSADQLLGFFEENQNNAAKITVDIKNVYNQLTGGLVINQSGPVTVIADGKSSVAPNGKLPAAPSSIPRASCSTRRIASALRKTATRPFCAYAA